MYFEEVNCEIKSKFNIVLGKKVSPFDSKITSVCECMKDLKRNARVMLQCKFEVLTEVASVGEYSAKKERRPEADARFLLKAKNQRTSSLLCVITSAV